MSFTCRKKGLFKKCLLKGFFGESRMFFLWHHCKKTKTFWNLYFFKSVGKHLFFKVMVVVDHSCLCAFPIWDGTENIEQSSLVYSYSGAKQINFTSSFGFRQLLAWRQLSHLYDVTSRSVASTRGEVIKQNRTGPRPLSPVPYPRLLDTDSLV